MPTRAVGAPPFTREFLSSPQAVTFNSVLTVPHTLGMVPKLVMITLRNFTAEASYQVNDEVVLASSTPTAGTASGINVVMSNVSVFLITAGSVSLRDKSSQADTSITAANWRFIVRAWA